MTDSLQTVAEDALERYRHCNDRGTAIVEEAVGAYQTLFASFGESPVPLSTYQGVTDLYVERLLREGHKDDADQAEIYVRTAMEAFPGDPSLVHKLVTVLRVRFERLGTLTFLDEAMALVEEAIVAAPEEDPIVPMLLEDCSLLLLDYAEVENDPRYIETSTEILRTALNIGGLPPQLLWTLTSHLAQTLRLQFETVGDLRDLMEARRLNKSVRAPEGVLKRTVLYVTLLRIKVTEAHFDCTLDQDILEELKREIAVTLPIIQDLHRGPINAEIFQTFGRSLNKKFFSVSGRQPETFNFIQTGLRTAIDVFSSWIPEGEDAYGLARFYFELGKVHELRSKGYWSPAELESALENYSTAFRSSKPRSAFFGLALGHFVSALRKFSGISSETLYLQYAREIAASSIRFRLSMLLRAKARLAEEFGHLVEAQYEDIPDITLLDRAVRHYDKACEYAQYDPDFLVKILDHCSSALLKKAKVSRDLKDLERAEGYMQRLRRVTKTTKATFQDGNLNQGILKDLQYQIAGNPAYGREAVQIFSAFYKNPIATQETKLVAAMRATTLQKSIEPGSYKTALVIAQCVDVVLECISDADQLQEILWKTRLLSSLAPAAASVALRIQGTSFLGTMVLRFSPPATILGSLYLRATHWLGSIRRRIFAWFHRECSRAPTTLPVIISNYELARSAIWKRRLDQKTDLATLADKHSSLAEELREVRLDLQLNKRFSIPRGPLRFRDEVRQNRFYTAERYNAVLARIRKQPGFENFMLPFSEQQDFRSYGKQGPVVIFVHNIDCHAILITERHLDFIRLPNFGEDECRAQYEKMGTALVDNTSQAADIMDEVLVWLWAAAAEPVLQRLGFITTRKVGRPLPRMWWVTSGWVNLLPIHAAGDHRRAIRSRDMCSVMDFAVSSYVPSLSVLASSRRTMDRMTSHFQDTGITMSTTTTKPSAFLAAMEVTPDISPDLPNAPIEIAAVENLLIHTHKCTSFATP
jgi:tetratricopeptide (TPR) repeat protein